MREQDFGKGGIKDKPDIRDFEYSKVGLALPPFDWGIGYDIEEVIEKKLTIKNQNGSGSCGGQAWSYYGQILDPDKDEKSYFQDYIVETDRSVTIHELLTMIRRDLDGTLAFRTYKCYKGMCQTCVVKLDGKVVKSCATQVMPDTEITLEPAGGGEVIRDLVVDFKAM